MMANKTISTKDLAAKAGIQYQTLRNIRTDTSKPSKSTLTAICKALGVGTKEILGENSMGDLCGVLKEDKPIVATGRKDKTYIPLTSLILLSNNERLSKLLHKKLVKSLSTPDRILLNQWLQSTLNNK